MTRMRRGGNDIVETNKKVVTNLFDLEFLFVTYFKNKITILKFEIIN